MGYNYVSYTADCLAILDNFHLRNVEWIGTSMGGIIGMMIAANNPGRIRKLVLNDVGIHLSREALMRIFSYVRSLPDHFSSRADADAYLRQVFEPFGIADTALWDAFVAHSLLTKNGALHYACDPAIAVPLAAASQNYTEVNDINLADLWDEIDIPTLIIRGEHSDILLPETVRAMRSTNMRAESVTIAGVGHAPSLMSDDQITIVTNWLTSLGSMALASGI
jgi:pimeloyl-ACP methyl ester carboxylesterase